MLKSGQKDASNPGQNSPMTYFSRATESPPDPIFGLAESFKRDLRPEKIDLMVGVYRDEALQCTKMNAVCKAEIKVVQQKVSPGYLPFVGDSSYLDRTAELLFGAERYREGMERIVAAQSIGGTGALHMGGEFLKAIGAKRIFISQPTWANHHKIFQMLGFEIELYPYYDIEKGEMLFGQMMESFENLEAGDVVLLHTCCHNPSGYDPTHEQWEIISNILQERGAIAYFDTAYQGFKVGLEEDVYPVRLFFDKGHEFISTQSFSKNFTLYNERIASLFLVSRESGYSHRVHSQVKGLIRGTYSNPPRHGQAVVEAVLSDPNLREEWEGELGAARERMQKMRELLSAKLKEEIPNRNWGHLDQAWGMFSFIGLQNHLVEELREKHAVYMTGKGRINVSGLNIENIDRVVGSIREVLG